MEPQAGEKRLSDIIDSSQGGRPKAGPGQGTKEKGRRIIGGGGKQDIQRADRL